jgi:hypothetical protein
LVDNFRTSESKSTRKFYSKCPAQPAARGDLAKTRPFAILLRITACWSGPKVKIAGNVSRKMATENPMSTTHLPARPDVSTVAPSDDEARLSHFLTYALSLPERVVRSAVGVTAGTAREAAHALVPEAFHSSKVYELVIASSLNFLTEDIGGVEQQARPGAAPNVDHFLARKAVGNFVDLAGLATLHLSPIWVFAVVSDVAYGSKVYLNELAAELRQRGLIRPDSSIDRVEDLLDALRSASGETANLISTPPLSVMQLKQSVEKIRLADPTAILPQQELAAQWNEIREIATREDVSLLGVSGALTMHMLSKVGTVAHGTLTGVEVAGGLFSRKILGHYASGLRAVREQGFYPLVSATSAPYRKAVWTNFAATRPTWTAQVVSGQLFRNLWHTARRKFKTQEQG